VTRMVPDPRVIRNAVILACRAPSLHNSQPWHWVAEGSVLHLFADHDRVVHAIDSSGREMTLSCGAVLDHLRVAMAAAGWHSLVDRLPDPGDPDRLATLAFTPMPFVSDADRRRADAILRRRTDRLPLASPAGWDSLERLLRRTADNYDVMFDVVADGSRPQLAEASLLTETLRRSDSTYQSELQWWTSPFEVRQGVPRSALVSAAEASRVDVARAFPPTGRDQRRIEIGPDRSKIVVLSTRSDSRPEVLRCGEALSAALLECTIAGMATCTLTHMTEVTPSRNMIGELTGRIGSPQLLIRIGRTPLEHGHFAATPRRALTDVLEFRDHAFEDCGYDG
jgi:hypothetical protein